ncbi:hypothetical protein CLAFUW4_07452 [Fulvia fulva]|uniref:Uncharacterized protein n=1 Tax=Passalora fulva TaxID=5499 RepID=A0A9Q8UQJ8_PASFU|nr:uncharacterized protein CLAFUR5_07582 [Fulvia fulva]KAK4621223.1 hypothetical protein CLAFUR4_07459 [Fulvia fulva]KAK4623315.1 hypothetical protein CLAFUR0_07458 [Fulvia fulva]UJO18849.1 hypothetical protein CLAFUR5_07582 [Fulvia fulva]WPV16131.1 hypothetical protein CLAFUW4_07452 [Fulvia fulva]WPV31694.1 hypothetical protein CLAFUW7_07455 [Fulvia fulva]
MDWSETDEDNEDDGSQAGSDAFRDTAQSIGEDEVGEAWTYRYLLRKAKKTISSTGEVQKQKMQRGEQRRRQDDEDTDGGEDHGRYEEDTESETVSELPRLRTQFRSIRDRKPGGLNVGLLRNAFLLIDQDSIDSLITNPAALAWGSPEEYRGYLRVRVQQEVNNF